MNAKFETVARRMAGELHWDPMTRRIFSTDASVYQQLPAAVAFPKNEDDLVLLIQLARETGLGIIPRTAGTSLAGQVVGDGIVVDVSRYFTGILSIDPEKKLVRVQPGVIRNELNQTLAPHGMQFSPETSTANRAMIGGMLGNNSCGANSIVYGTTREQALSVSGFLSDGSRVTFEPLDESGLRQKLDAPGDSLERRIYRGIVALLGDPAAQDEILSGFPKASIHRRNTGYALDALLSMQPFRPDGAPLNLSALVAGSEGTLFLATAMALRCDPLPPKHRALVCAHFSTLEQALRATPLVMHSTGGGKVFACELIDHHVLEGAARNLEQQHNLQFVRGTPAAVLLVELRDDRLHNALDQARIVVERLQQAGLGYEWPVFADELAEPIWELRRAGLGVLTNAVGDLKPVTVIEDTAVAMDDFADYTLELGEMLRTRYGLVCVHYGHAGAGELHLRPLLNLKDAADVSKFRDVAQDVAALVQKYGGSLSGEHGDGRLRGEFLQQMVGPQNYQRMLQLKRLFDPDNLFNPGKIVATAPMDQSLRYPPAELPESSQVVAASGLSVLETVLDFSATGGLLRSAEMCNGSGDCRKTHLSGGTMCPSYMATRNERDTTRARANLLRQVLSGATSREALDDDDLHRVMDLCLSCKGCKRECPSNVDMPRMKAEFLQARHDRRGIPLRTRMVAGISTIHHWASALPGLHNWLVDGPITGWMARWMAGVHPQRRIPRLQPVPFRKWVARRKTPPVTRAKQTVILFVDEFTNWMDVPVGIAAVELLEGLGFAVRIVPHLESGRAAISKGMLRQARKIADQNVQLLDREISAVTPLVGLEPSAILTVTDEYPDLVSPALRGTARRLAANSMLIDRFLAVKIDSREIGAASFTSQPQNIRLHGHCHQKAITSLADTVRILQLPEHYRVRMIPSGCCGMAGSFGYEREHYDVSMRIGELVLFPVIRSEPGESLIAAPGTSCRHQIWDGTGRVALHPVQILRKALRANIQ